MKDKEVRDEKYTTSPGPVKAPDADFLLDRANGPRTRPFPSWSDVARWHEDLGAYVHGARTWPRHGLVRIYLAPHNCSDMTGTIFSALFAGHAVHRIEVFSGSELSTFYRRNEAGEWEAYRPHCWPGPANEGDALELPPTHEKQASYGSAPMPFADRPGTDTAIIRANRLRDFEVELKAEVERRVSALRAEVTPAIEAYKRKIRGGK